MAGNWLMATVLHDIVPSCFTSSPLSATILTLRIILTQWLILTMRLIESEASDVLDSLDEFD